MILLNFSHPLTPDQIRQAEQLSGNPITQIHEFPVQFDPALPFEPQLDALLQSLPLTPAELQSEAILINPPSLNFITALLLAELHGRMGYFPPILRLRLVPGSLPPRYEAAEILNLQQIRERSRTKRF